ncbi:MAG: signal peptidase I [Planctomycetes bacterium]|nr:signal peptidase I [Planctomycetota bacterium]
MSAQAQKQAPPRRPWRDNIEAVTMAIVMAVMLKYFIVEAYKIPTGSMQPTLMGNEDTGIFDRILVDKLSYHLRDPERFEIVVFKYPLDRSKNFIKRLCGMPDEELRIEDGDLWTRKDGSQPWKVLRRPKPVQDAQWKVLDARAPQYASWKPDAGARGWKLEGRAHIEASGSGSVSLPNNDSSVLDRYVDGYPGRTGEVIEQSLQRQRPSLASGSNPVGDLRLTGSIRAGADCKHVRVQFREGACRYTLEIPGPAAPAGERASIRAVDGSGELGSVQDAGSARLAAGSSTNFAAQNMDDLLQLDFGGTHLELEIPEQSDQHSGFRIEVEGSAVIDGLETYRDIYYTSDRGMTSFQIPHGCYVMLGDNTQDSADSREWNLMRFRMRGGDGPWIQGNSREDYSGNDPSGNPRRVTGDPGGTRLFFRDQWGELHNFLEKDAEKGSSIAAPYVPRELVIGRALLVFWPNNPMNGLNVWRLKWAR